jgi:hypothetical protein
MIKRTVIRSGTVIDEQGYKFDGYLCAPDIYKLQTSADLVVLKAYRKRKARTDRKDAVRFPPIADSYT